MCVKPYTTVVLLLLTNVHIHKPLHKPFWDQELTELWKVMKDRNKLYTKEKKSGSRRVKSLFDDFIAARNVFDKTLRRKETPGFLARY